MSQYESLHMGETFIPDADSDDLDDPDIPSDEDWNDASDLAECPFQVLYILGP